MDPKHFRRDVLSFDEKQRLRLVHTLWTEREANAEAAWRIGRQVDGYDNVGYWPHNHKPHDDLVDPLRIGRVVGIGVGLLATVAITNESFENATMLVHAVTMSGFIGVSLAAEAAMSAWLPFFKRLEFGAKWVARFFMLAGVPLSFWMVMRIDHSPLAWLAGDWSGMALAVSEIGFILFAASAGSAKAAYAWSREYTAKDEDFRRRLIDLGEDVERADADRGAA